MSSSLTPHRRSIPAGEESVRLLEIEPDLGWLLTAEDRQAAAAISLPTRAVDAGADFRLELEHVGAFAAILLDGVVVHEARMHGHVGIRLIGPGDVVIASAWPDPLVLTGSSWTATCPVRAAFLGTRMLVDIGRWPQLMVGLYRQVGHQIDRVAAQLLVCQLPRVEDRLLALMWLLADSWGRVTAAGTRLSLNVTHEALGKMIGARRPTVTLALGALGDMGAILKQEDGWLLLKPPVETSRPPAARRVSAVTPLGGYGLPHAG